MKAALLSGFHLLFINELLKHNLVMVLLRRAALNTDEVLEVLVRVLVNYTLLRLPAGVSARDEERLHSVFIELALIALDGHTNLHKFVWFSAELRAIRTQVLVNYVSFRLE